MAKSNIEKLMELKQLYEAGILTKDEMEAEKQKILGQSHSNNIKSEAEKTVDNSASVKEQFNTRDNDVAKDNSELADDNVATVIKEEENSSFFQKHKIYIIMSTIIAVICILFFSINSNSEMSQAPTIEADNIDVNDQEPKIAATQAIPPMEKKDEESVQTKPTYKEWKLGYGTDDYGDEVKDIQHISVDLDAYYPKDGETGKGISICYCYNKNTGIEVLMFSSSQSLGKYEEISFKTKDGSQIDFNGTYGGREGQHYSGCVAFYDIDDMKSIAEILNEGNFKLKVGYYVADVKDETRGFRESVEKHFKGEDIEILLPRITRE